MWTLEHLNCPSSWAPLTYACDGQPLLHHSRNAADGRCRIMVANQGYIDMTCLRDPAAGAPGELSIQGMVFQFNAPLTLTLDLREDGSCSVTCNTLSWTGFLSPIPQIPGSNLQRFNEMVERKLVPYQNPPTGTPKSEAELWELAKTHYPNDPYGYTKALCLYDWTSASFIRQDLFHQLQYTGIPACPLDLHTMARVIWGCNYPGYTAADPNFMNQFAMKPATSEADVYQQLLTVFSDIHPLALAEMNVQTQALLTLPRPTVAAYPQLYRGAMPMSGGYDTSDFSPSLFEFAGNAGPVDQPLIQPLDQALQDTLQPGKILTTKGPWSFSNDLDGAKVWQNGILITCNPPNGATLWPSCADITPFSLNPGTFEINVPANTRYRIDSYEWITLQGKPVCHFTMTLLGYFGPYG